MSNSFEDLSFRDKESKHHREADSGLTKIAVTIEDGTDPRSPESDTALETISAIKCIYHVAGGVLKASDDMSFENAQVIGVTRTASVSGGVIKYYTSGRMDDSSFVFAPGAQLYLGTNGAITDQEPTQNFRTKIGSALEVGAIMINIDEPIEL
tara:strand:- start:1954 stop:2412 length:459 start_codon:yes stop_codon:yes gene_type:complete